jgi:hypothetical protein
VEVDAVTAAELQFDGAAVNPARYSSISSWLVTHRWSNSPWRWCTGTVIWPHTSARRAIQPPVMSSSSAFGTSVFDG